MGKREQIETRQKLAEQALQDVAAGRADFVKGSWCMENGKLAPWNREAKRRWASKDLLLATYHADTVDQREGEHRKARWNLDWYKDRVCDGCTELHTDQHGKPFLDDEGNPRVKHEFHVSTAEFAEMQERERRLRREMELAQNEQLSFIQTIADAHGMPSSLLDELGHEQKVHAALLLMHLEAGILEEREGKPLTVSALAAKIAKMEEQIARDEAIPEGRVSDHGFLSREQREERLVGARSGVAFLRWLLDHHAYKLPA